MSCTPSENLKCPRLYFAKAWTFCGDSSGRWNRKKPQPPCLEFSTGIELGLKFPPRAGKHRYDFRNTPSLEQSQPGAKEKGNFLTCFYQLWQQRTMTVQYTSPRVCLGPADSFAPFHLKREKENSKGETRGAGLGESAFIQSLQALLQLRGMPQLGKPMSSQPHFLSFQHMMENKCIWGTSEQHRENISWCLRSCQHFQGVFYTLNAPGSIGLFIYFNWEYQLKKQQQRELYNLLGSEWEISPCALAEDHCTFTHCCGGTHPTQLQMPTKAPSFSQLPAITFHS